MPRKKDSTPPTDGDANHDHFEKKAAWKSQPENRYRSDEATPMDNLQLVTKPQPGGLVLNWA